MVPQNFTEGFCFELIDKYQYGARVGLEEAAKIIAAHKEEKSTYTVDEIVSFLLAVARRLDDASSKESKKL